MFKKISLMLPMLCAPLAFFACGEGESNSGMSAYDDFLAQFDVVVDSYDDLKICNDNREGVWAYAKYEVASYSCKDGEWIAHHDVIYSEQDVYGEKCSRKKIGKIIAGNEKESEEFYCTSRGWVSLTNGWSWDVPRDVYLNPKITYGTLTDPRDDKEYKTVKIGAQVWMAENLNYADSVRNPTLKGSSWCYENKEKYCDVEGRLYTWDAAVDSGCPEGWHLPTYGEWQILITVVGSSIAGEVLRSSRGWYSGGNGTDDYGFSALPAGSSIGDAGNADKYAHFWSATGNKRAGWLAYHMILMNGYADLENDDKGYAKSVRCLQNN